MHFSTKDQMNAKELVFIFTTGSFPSYIAPWRRSVSPSVFLGSQHVELHEVSVQASREPLGDGLCCRTPRPSSQSACISHKLSWQAAKLGKRGDHVA